MSFSGRSDNPLTPIYLGICDSANKPRTIADYDSVVCAEIPDKDIFPELYKIVTKFMMHGPCGVANPNSPCMEDGKCIKKFLKDLHTSDNGV